MACAFVVSGAALVAASSPPFRRFRIVRLFRCSRGSRCSQCSRRRLCGTHCMLSEIGTYEKEEEEEQQEQGAAAALYF